MPKPPMTAEQYRAEERKIIAQRLNVKEEIEKYKKEIAAQNEKQKPKAAAAAAH